MFDLIAILIPVVLAVCIVLVVHIVAEARLRRHIVDNAVDERLAAILLGSGHEHRRRGSMRWGLFLVMLGLAFAAIGLLDLGTDHPYSYALVFTAAGLALLLFRRLDAG